MISTVYLSTSCSLTSDVLSLSRLRWLLTAWKLSFHITHMMLPQRGLTLWTWMFNRQSHVFNYYIGHFYARMFLRFTPSPRALYSPPLLFLPFPYSSGDHCYSLTSLHPKLPHAVPVLTDCVAAASAEITTQHPGGEQPADGIDYLYCQNNQLGRMPTLACLDVGESEDLEWRIGRIFFFFSFFTCCRSGWIPNRSWSTSSGLPHAYPHKITLGEMYVYVHVCSSHINAQTPTGMTFYHVTHSVVLMQHS